MAFLRHEVDAMVIPPDLMNIDPDNSVTEGKAEVTIFRQCRKSKFLTLNVKT